MLRQRELKSADYPLKLQAYLGGKSYHLFVLLPSSLCALFHFSLAQIFLFYFNGNARGGGRELQSFLFSLLLPKEFTEVNFEKQYLLPDVQKQTPR